MPIQRPTESSRNRNAATERRQQECAKLSGRAKRSPAKSQTPLAKELFKDARPTNGRASSYPLPDYSHVPSRVDTGLRHRVKSLFSWGQQQKPTSSSRTQSGESVVQRAEDLLERTRQQQLHVVHELDRRAHHTPSSQSVEVERMASATPPPPVAPPTSPRGVSPVSPIYTGHRPTNDSTASFATNNTLTSQSQNSSMLSSTPASPMPLEPRTSLLGRILRPLHRFSSGQPLPHSQQQQQQSGTTESASFVSHRSATPSPRYRSVSPSQPRKSVQFFAGPRLESITPIKTYEPMHESSSSSSSSSSDAGKMEEADVAERPTKTSRLEGGSPSARSGSSPKQKKMPENEEAHATPHRRSSELHLDMVHFLQHNTVKRCLNAYTKTELRHFLHAEGVALHSTETLSKKALVDEARALVR